MLHGKARHPELLAHDVKHRLLVRRLRGAGHRSFANAGYWFLTHDTVLPRYDYKAAGREGTLPFCVSASSWFQVVEAFRPKTEDLEQTVADILASPYVRPRRTISKRAAQAVVARVALYKDGTPELAARVFMNSAAMSQIEKASSGEEQTEKIEKAIITAAREAQEDAKAAQEAAAAERANAQRAAEEAAARVREADERRERDIAASEALGARALRDEEARSADALRAERARVEAALSEERDRHRQELERKEEARLAAEAATEAFRRRLGLTVAGVVGVLAFIVIGLAAGVDNAWTYVIGAGVLIGLIAGVDQFLARRFGPRA